MLPEKAILEFKQIYKREYGEDLTDEEATERAYAVYDFFKIIYSSIDKP